MSRLANGKRARTVLLRCYFGNCDVRVEDESCGLYSSVKLLIQQLQQNALAHGHRLRRLYRAVWAKYMPIKGASILGDITCDTRPPPAV
jgi:hypothetical protein